MRKIYVSIFAIFIISTIIFVFYSKNNRVSVVTSKELDEKDFVIQLCGEDFPKTIIFKNGELFKIPPLNYGVSVIIFYKNQAYNNTGFFIQPEDDEQKIKINFIFSKPSNDSINCTFSTIGLRKNLSEQFNISKDIKNYNYHDECY